jgi:hypothetical protein
MPARLGRHRYADLSDETRRIPICSREVTRQSFSIQATLALMVFTSAFGYSLPRRSDVGGPLAPCILRPASSINLIEISKNPRRAGAHTFFPFGWELFPPLLPLRSTLNFELASARRATIGATHGFDHCTSIPPTQILFPLTLNFKF